MQIINKTVIITGANTGLGYYCAKHIAFAKKGWHIVLACRNSEKGNLALNKLISETSNPNISFLELDLASFSSVRNFVATFQNKKLPPLNGIICNAGLSGKDTAIFTKDGIENTFQVNCLSHFLLINLMLNDLSSNARILMVSSELHRNDGPMKSFLPNYTNAQDLAHPLPEKANQKGSGSIRYSTSKLCMVFYTHEFCERFKQSKFNHVSINAFNPGLMPDTGLGDLNKKIIQKLFLKYLLPLFVKGANGTPDKSGKYLANLILSEKVQGITGKYFDREKETEPSAESFDKSKSLDLWNTSIKLTNIENSIQ